MAKQEEKRLSSAKSKWLFSAIAIILLFWSGFWLVSNAKNYSITSDEVVYLPVGLRYLERGDSIMNVEHPPIFKIVSAIPAFFMSHNLEKAVAEDNGNQWKFGFTFWFSSGNDVQNLLFAGRAPTIILTLLLMFSVWSWTRKNIGEWAGIGALVSLAFNPNVLAHGCLVANDIYLAAGAWFLFVATFHFIKTNNWKTAIWYGLALCFAALSKYTGLIFVGLSGLVVISYFIFSKNRPKHPLSTILLSIFAALILTWAIFLFIDRREVFSAQPVTLGLYKNYERQTKKILPKFLLLPYVRVREGLVATSGHNKIGHRAYLNGEISQFGWKSYFLWVLWYKTPTVILVFALVGTLFAFIKKNWPLVLLLLATAISLVTASLGHIQTGVRYILFVYLAFSPLVGLALQELIDLRKNRVMIPTLAIMGMVLIGDVAAGGFASIGYFSYLSGGWQKGYMHLADSNLDWGEEFYQLEKYILKNRPKNLIIGISSGETLANVGIESQPLQGMTCADIKPDSTIIASRNYVVGFFGPLPCLKDALEEGKAKLLGRTYLIFESNNLPH